LNTEGIVNVDKNRLLSEKPVEIKIWLNATNPEIPDLNQKVCFSGDRSLRLCYRRRRKNGKVRRNALPVATTRYLYFPT
jgi:hypothetical protein